MDTLEEKAIAVGNDPKKLKARIMRAKAVLKTPFRIRFSKNIWDLKNKRMLSDDGELFLQWFVREYPDKPESYENQQTSVGAVLLLFVPKKKLLSL